MRKPQDVRVHGELLSYRDQFPILAKKKGYLINNSLGAMPAKVYDNLKAYADKWAEEGVVAWHDWLPMVTETANLVGGIFGAPKGTMMMHQNVSTLLAIVASGLEYTKKRNRILYTDLNFPTVHYNWREQERRGAKPVMLKSKDRLGLDTQQVIDAIDEKTLLVSLDLVLFRSSGVVDIKPIIEAAHRKGAMVLIDVYQAAGALPFDVAKLGVDFLVGGSVKWLCGGPGAAYLYVRKDLIRKFEPTMTGWFSHRAPFAFDMGRVEYADDMHRYMGGSPSVPALYAARAGYEIIREVGVKKIRERSLSLTSLVMQRADEQGLTVNTPRDPARRGGTVCVDFEGAERAHDLLIERGYMVDYRPNGGIRISPHFYNSEEECEGIMSEIAELRRDPKLLKSKKKTVRAH